MKKISNFFLRPVNGLQVLQGLEALLLLISIGIVIDIIRRHVMLAATDITFYPINGTFQTYNPLKRISTGELIGRDFDSYLGIGTVYSTYILYKIFGGTVAASEAATYLLHASAFGILGYISGRLAGLRPLTSTWLAIGCLIAGRYTRFFLWNQYPYILEHTQSLKTFYHPQVLIRLTEYVFYPGNSMLGWRVALTFLTSFAIIAIYKINPTWKRAILMGIILGSQLFWSNDYGTSSTLALLIGGFLWFIPKRNLKNLGSSQSSQNKTDWSWKNLLKSYILYIGTGIVTFFSLGSLLTGGHVFRWLNYNWRDVRNDQFWYFVGNKAYRLNQLFINKTWMTVFIILLIVCLLLILIGWYFSDVKAYAMTYMLSTSLIAWLLSSVGSYVDLRYPSPTILISLGAFLYLMIFLLSKLVILLTYFNRWIARVLAKQLSSRQALNKWFEKYTPTFYNLNSQIIQNEKNKITLQANHLAPNNLQQFLRWSFCILSMFGIGVYYYHAFFLENHHLSVSHYDFNHTYTYVKELDGFIKNELYEGVLLGRAIAHELQDVPSEQRVFSTYKTALDVAAGATQPTRHDYIIHALGAERQRYLDTFLAVKPAYVTTIRESFTPWATWNYRLNWWFHKLVMLYYQPVAITTYNTVWKRLERPLAQPHWELPCQVEKIDEAHSNILIGDLQGPYVDVGSWYVEVSFDYYATIDDTGVPIIGKRGLFNVGEYGTAAREKHALHNLPLEFNRSATNTLATEHFPGFASRIELEATPIDRTHLEIQSCQAKVVSPTLHEAQDSTIDGWILAPIWQEGIAKHEWISLSQQPWLRNIATRWPIAVYDNVSGVTDRLNDTRGNTQTNQESEESLDESVNEEKLFLEITTVPHLTPRSQTTNRRYIYDLSDLNLSGKDIDALTIDTHCRFPNRGVDRVKGPIAHFTWYGEGVKPRDSTLNLPVTNLGKTVVSLDTEEWRKIEKLEQITVELLYPQHCGEFISSEMILYRDRPAILSTGDLIPPGIVRVDMIELEPGYYEITGNDPGLVFDISKLGISTDYINVVGLSFSCETDDETSLTKMPDLQLFWRDKTRDFSGDAYMQVNPEKNHSRVYFDVANQKNWQGDLQELRLDMTPAETCTRVRVSQLTLYQAFHEATDVFIYDK